jgi:tetratricopeptide (TPR) repeat protein
MDSNTARADRLRDFLAADPANARLACDLVDALMAQGALDEAQRVLATLPDTAASDPSVRFRAAHLALAFGRYAEAETVCRGLLDAGVDVSAVHHDLAFALLCLRRAEEAYRTAEAAAARHGDDAGLALVRARAAVMQERYDIAAADVATAVRLAPERADAWGVAALVALDADALPDAETAAHAALDRDPDQHEALLTLGTLALWAQDIDAAQAAFTRALQRHPNSGRVLSGLGQVLMLRNDVPGAIDALERAVVAMPDHIGTWHALGWARLLQGQIDAADAAYRAAYEIDRNFGDTHGGLALVAALRGRYDDADAAAKRALRLDPNAMTARYAQSLLLQARGDDDAADRVVGELMAGAPALAGLSPRDFAARLRATLQPARL